MLPTIVFFLVLFISIAGLANMLSCIFNRDSIVKMKGIDHLNSCVKTAYFCLFLGSLLWSWLFWLLH